MISPPCSYLAASSVCKIKRLRTARVAVGDRSGRCGMVDVRVVLWDAASPLAAPVGAWRCSARHTVLRPFLRRSPGPFAHARLSVSTRARAHAPSKNINHPERTSRLSSRILPRARLPSCSTPRTGPTPPGDAHDVDAVSVALRVGLLQPGIEVGGWLAGARGEM